MEIQLKQRLIGAVVIFTLLIIFLPMIFEGDSEQKYVEQILEPPIPNRVDNNNRVLKLSDSPNQDKTSVAFDNLDNLDGLILDNPSKKLEKVKSSDSKKVDMKSIEDEYISSLKFIDEDTLEINHDIKSKSIEKYKKAKKTQVDTSEVSRDVTVKNTKANSVVKTAQSSSAAKVETIKTPANTQAKNSASLKRANNEVYAVKVVTYKNKSTAESVKSYLLDIGMPAYINYKAGFYSVYVGPEIELKYVKALSDRVKEETKYKPEVIIHDVNWKTE